MNKNRADIVYVSSFALIACLSTFVGVDGLVRALCVLPLAFMLPGYALLSALFENASFGWVERGFYAVGASIIITILSGLLLNLTPWGLQAQSWSLLLAGLTLALCVVASRRRLPVQTNLPRLGLAPLSIILYAVAALTLTSAIAFAHTQAEQLSVEEGAQLWMLPAQADRPTLQVGIDSTGIAPATYRLLIKADGKVLREWPNLTLAGGEQWQTTLDGASIAGVVGPIQAQLYQANAPDTIYRQTQVWPETFSK